MKIHLIAACEDNWGIGINGRLPWKLPDEYAYFERMSIGDRPNGKMNITVTGRVNWDQRDGQALDDRYNFVMSRTLKEKPENADALVHSLDELAELLESDAWKGKYNQIWCIGGADIYDLVQRSIYCGIAFITKINGHYPSDRFYPAKYLEENFELSNDIPDEFLKHIPKEGRQERGKWKVFVYQRKT